MSRGLPKLFDVYDENDQLIMSRSKAIHISEFLEINYTRLYDIANLNRSFNGYKVRYSKVIKPEIQRFYCQNCREIVSIKPLEIKDRKRGSLKCCSIKCLDQMKYKLQRMDMGYE